MAVRLTPTVTIYQRRDWQARLWDDFTAQPFPQEGFIHHTTDPLAEHMDTLAEQKAVARGIQRYHMDTNGWSDIAYHFLVFQPYGHRKYARVFEGRPIGHVPAAQLHHNTGTLAIAVVGNFDHDDSFKDATRHAILALLRVYRTHGLRTLGGHRDVVGTECPGDTLYAQITRMAHDAKLDRYPQYRAPKEITTEEGAIVGESLANVPGGHACCSAFMGEGS